jgi:hypothetical protein
MVNLYVSLINKGLRTLEQVPGVWRDEVKEQLEKQEVAE